MSAQTSLANALQRTVTNGLTLAILAGLGHPAPALTQVAVAGFEVIEPVDGLYVLQSPPGGNILIVDGGADVLVVDAQDGTLADSLTAALIELGVTEPRLVVNTHYHWDHIGGNAAFRAMGVTTLAHSNVPVRAVVDTVITELDWHREAADPANLPGLEIDRDTVFEIGEERVVVEHIPAAHTDGDLIVRVTAADVVHTGDLVEVGAYPFVDWWAGGSLDGLIDAVGHLLDTTGPGTTFVPGHGRLVDRAFVAEYRDMLRVIRAGLVEAIEQGRTWEEIRELGLTAEFDARNGGPRRGRQFLGLLYLGLAPAEGRS